MSDSASRRAATAEPGVAKSWHSHHAISSARQQDGRGVHQNDFAIAECISRPDICPIRFYDLGPLMCVHRKGIVPTGYATRIVTTPRRLSLWYLTGIENATNRQPLGEASHASDQSAGRTCVATHRYLRPTTQLTWNDRSHCHGQNEASSTMVDVVEVTTSADAYILGSLPTT